MDYDLGLQGLALLIIPALAFGLVAQLIVWKSATHWMWLIGAIAWFSGGLFASEVLFGAETTEETSSRSSMGCSGTRRSSVGS